MMRYIIIFITILISQNINAQVDSIEVISKANCSQLGNNVVIFDIYTKALHPGDTVTITDQNFRFDYDTLAIGNPSIVTNTGGLGFNNPVISNNGNISFFSLPTLTGSIANVISFNIEMSGGDGLPLTYMEETYMGSIAFDALDLSLPYNFNWHHCVGSTDNFPPTVIINQNLPEIIYGIFTYEDCSLVECVSSKPTGLYSSGINLHWNAVLGAVSYTVSFSPGGNRFCPCPNYVQYPDKHTTNTFITRSRFQNCFVWRVTAICADGTEVTSASVCYGRSFGPTILTGGGKIENSNNPVSTNLSNFPNPFKDITTIEFKLETDTKVKLFVTDVSGKQVASILDNEKVSGGVYQVDFDGSLLSTGIYFCTIETDQFTVSKRMILSK